MALNSSGPISLAGTTAGQSIELENGGNGTTQISLNDAAVRTLAGVASGAITMPTDFYGKSNRVALTYTFSANTANASLNVTSISGYSAGKSDITITVNAGVYVYSTSTGNAGLTLTGGTSGDTVTLVNNGYIMGMGGGVGYNYTNWNGFAGGNAISLGFNTTINNTNASAYIGGGGGGGGGSDGTYNNCGGGGGAGGGQGGGVPAWPNKGGAGGSPGNAGSNGTNSGNDGIPPGGGGGRIFPGTGGAQSYVGPGPVYSDQCSGFGGGAGGGGACGQAYTKSGWYVVGAGGGGGWGASGGNSRYGKPSPDSSGVVHGGAGGSGNAAGSNASGTANAGTGSGGAGGKAVALNGNTVTWTSGNTTRVYGAIS